MDTLYPETRNPADFTAWEKSDSDYECTKAAAYIRYSQIADVLEYVHTGYIADEGLNNRHCEYALNLLDVVNRFGGGDIGTRFSPGQRTALVPTGEAIDPSVFGSVERKKERYQALLSRIKTDLQTVSLRIEDSLKG